jgi:cyclopropane fatty-acyl-phospholipid synthase-like methyltransferase
MQGAEISSGTRSKEESRGSDPRASDARAGDALALDVDARSASRRAAASGVSAGTSGVSVGKGGAVKTIESGNGAELAGDLRRRASARAKGAVWSDAEASASASAEALPSVVGALATSLELGERATDVAPPSSGPASIVPSSLPASSSEMSRTDSLPLSDYVVFNDAKLARKYATESIPISTLYEAYFDGSIDIPGDLSEFLRQRQYFVKHTITRQHLQWAVTNFVPEFVAHSKESDARAMRELYDERGDEFFRAFLGERLSYTCAHFAAAGDSLDSAQEASSERICQKLGLRPGLRLLDVGSGWGTLLAHAAKHHGVDATGVTLSDSQASYARQRFEQLGIAGRARVLNLDYRDMPAEKFDRIVCLEMVEHVGAKNLKGFFEQLVPRLVDDGLFVLQWTGLRRLLRPEDLMWGLFMNKFIFPGADGALPLSSMLKVVEKAGWEVQSVENTSTHYVHTLRAWRRNWEASRATVTATHGERWYRVWHFFLAWSELVAEQGSAASYQVLLNKNLDGYDRRSLR